MEPFHVKNGDVDVKGRAFEEFLPSQLRGEGLGQYFTPRPVVNFMTELAGVSIHDIVVDFACGSGGFLIKAFDRMNERIGQMPAGTLKRLGLDRAQMLEDVKAHQIFGIDAEPRAARTAKMNMLMWGDGRQVVRGNALATTDDSGKPYEPAEYSPDQPESGCTLILANPPFGSKEKDEAILQRYVLGTKFRDKKKTNGSASQRTEVLFLEKGMKLLRPEGRMLIVIPQGLLSGTSYDFVRDYLRSEAEIRAIISLPTHTFVQSGVPTVNTCVLYVQKFTEEKKELYDERSRGQSKEKIREMLRSDPDFDYPIFMATAEFVGYEPSGRMIVESGEETDLDLILKDFANQTVITNSDTDLFEFAAKHYGEKSPLRREQTVRGTERGLKTSFVVHFNRTEDRLDPPYYFFRHQAAQLLDTLKPLGTSIERSGPKWRPESDEELDTEYPILSVSSDGKLTLNEYRRGEDLVQGTRRGSRQAKPSDAAGSGDGREASASPAYRKVEAGDIVYNPMRINIGSVGCVPSEFAGALVSPDYVVFKSKNLNPAFLVNLLRSPFYRMYIDVVTTGSIRDRLLFDDLKLLRAPTPAPTIQVAACVDVRRVDEEIAKMLAEVSNEKAKTVKRFHDLIHPSGANDKSADDLRHKFDRLVADWKAGRRATGTAKKMAEHSAYREIIALGRPVVPLILAELNRTPDHWFIALHEITKASPVPDGARGNLAEMTKAWVKWWEKESD
jgi:type I restriction enzyme M protein